MNNWICLAIAILAETVATTALKASAGFTRPWLVMNLFSKTAGH
jgi:small multidrug resistance pump